jgi:hypothetical protein
MTANRPSQIVQPEVRDIAKRPAATMRTDLNSMLLPLFAEDSRFKEFSASLDGWKIKIRSKKGGRSIAGATDRKLLSLLAGYVATMIRENTPVSRHISVDVAGLMQDMFGETVHGGADYARLTERLGRLKATVLETEAVLPCGDIRHRLFSWLDKVQYDRSEGPGGRKINDLKISFSEDAFEWITRAAGIDMPPAAYQSVGASRISSWRIYEICLARLISSGKEHTWISLLDLRDRIPITSELKVFKSRTLRLAMSAIEGSEDMSGHIRLHLARREGDQWKEVAFSDRGALSNLVVVISKGPKPLPRSTPLLASSNTVEGCQM